MPPISNGPTARWALSFSLPRGYESPCGWLPPLPLTRVQNRQPHDLVPLITDDHVIIRQFAIRSERRLLKVHVQHIRILIVSRPEESPRRFQNRRCQFKDSLRINHGHNRLRCSSDLIRRERNAVIINPSLSSPSLVEF